jgi:hypothetical protein
LEKDKATVFIGAGELFHLKGPFEAHHQISIFRKQKGPKGRILRHQLLSLTDKEAHHRLSHRLHSHYPLCGICTKENLTLF